MNNNQRAAKNWILIISLRGNKREHSCGHLDYTEFTANVYGDRITSTDVTLNKGETLCRSCLLKSMRTSILHCGRCGRTICPGDQVMVHPFNHSINRVWATIVRTSVHAKQGALTCLRRECCPSPALMSGSWDGKQYQPFAGGASIAELAMRANQSIIVQLPPRSAQA